MGRLGSRLAFPLGGYIQAIGDIAPAATFALPFENGSRVTYEWRTNVFTSWNGLEQRHSLLRLPRQRYALSTLLDDDQQREVMGVIADRAADGAAFLLALPFEDLGVVSGGGTSLGVTSLASADWVVPGQRAIVVSRSGEVADATIQSASGTTIALDDMPSNIGEVGARIMPGMVVYLDPEQSLSRYVVNAGRWDLSAIAQRFRWGTSTSLPGIGATLAEHDGIPIWDRGIATEEAAQPVWSGVDVQDAGWAVKQLYRQSHPTWGRAIYIESSSRSEWQWFKRFIHTVRGRWRTFLLPSGRPDLIAASDASSGVLTVEGDYIGKWYPSLAHRRLAIVKADGSIAYRTIEDVADNLDGTNDLTLGSATAGAIERVEFLELCRLDADEVTVNFAGKAFASELTARVVQQ